MGKSLRRIFRRLVFYFGCSIDLLCVFENVIFFLWVYGFLFVKEESWGVGSVA